LATGRLFNGLPCDWINMNIEDLDLEPMINAMHYAIEGLVEHETHFFGIGEIEKVGQNEGEVSVLFDGLVRVGYFIEFGLSKRWCWVEVMVGYVGEYIARGVKGATMLEWVVESDVGEVRRGRVEYQGRCKRVERMVSWICIGIMFRQR
nr:hypothetical protein [Tanacetum cinerariifolium]